MAPSGKDRYFATAIGAVEIQSLRAWFGLSATKPPIASGCELCIKAGWPDIASAAKVLLSANAEGQAGRVVANSRGIPGRVRLTGGAEEGIGDLVGGEVRRVNGR